MIRLYSLFVLIDLALIVIALIDCLSAEEFQIRALPRVVWVFLILLFSPIGAIAWFVAGRPARAVPLSNGTTWRPGSGFPEKERPRRNSPDDDPEFLARLNKDSPNKDSRNQDRTGDEELMRRLEADLRRREEELRKPGPADE